MHLKQTRPQVFLQKVSKTPRLFGRPFDPVLRVSKSTTPNHVKIPKSCF